ncbi:MAG: TonB-dependent receptor, partial [Saprospiraceae bacterium]|nr:TonB-dependent receptor [Saprospiraceae bacterium]
MIKYLLLFLFTSLVFQGFAQTQDSLSVNLSEIVVQENRMALPFSTHSRSIEIITADKIQRSPAISVAEVLRYAAGVDIRQRGAHGVQ